MRAARPPIGHSGSLTSGQKDRLLAEFQQAQSWRKYNRCCNLSPVSFRDRIVLSRYVALCLQVGDVLVCSELSTYAVLLFSLKSGIHQTHSCSQVLLILVRSTFGLSLLVVAQISKPEISAPKSHLTRQRLSSKSFLKSFASFTVSAAVLSVFCFFCNFCFRRVVDFVLGSGSLDGEYQSQGSEEFFGRPRKRDASGRSFCSRGRLHCCLLGYSPSPYKFALCSSPFSCCNIKLTAEADVLLA